MACTPTLGWICAHRSIADKAELTLGAALAEAMRVGDTSNFPGQRYHNSHGHSGYTGCIGGAQVIVDCLPQPPRAADAARAARTLAAQCDAVVLAGFACSARREVRLRDLVIHRDATSTGTGTGSATDAGTDTDTNIALSAVDVLRGEVGSAGFWLGSNIPPYRHAEDSARLHYGRIGPKADGEEDREARDSDTLCFETDFADMRSDAWPTPLVVVAVTASAGRVEEEPRPGLPGLDQEAANVVGYLVELATLAAELAAGGGPPTLASLAGSEVTVPSTGAAPPVLPPFVAYDFPAHGDVVLLVVPSANAAKARLLHDAVLAQAPPGASVLLDTAPFDSGVGEQPYDAMGLVGAHTRVANALRALDGPAARRGLAARRVGTVLVASVESYVRTSHAAAMPIDYGLVVVYNASRRRAAAGLSAGVTLPPAYVRRARRFGWADGRPGCGRVTVGQVLAARVPGLDKANWHAVLAGVSRYDLLRSAAAQLIIPW